MMHKIIVVADPGIDGAFAITLALFDPEIDVLGLAATAVNVSADQATQNMQILIEQIDPPRWPRLGAAVPVTYEMSGERLHGPGGFGGINFPCAELHHQHSSDKLLIDAAIRYDNYNYSLAPSTNIGARSHQALNSPIMPCRRPTLLCSTQAIGSPVALA